MATEIFQTGVIIEVVERGKQGPPGEALPSRDEMIDTAISPERKSVLVRGYPSASGRAATYRRAGPSEVARYPWQASFRSRDRFDPDGACSTGWWALIPPDDGRAFHAIMGSISTASWATIPRDRGHFWPTV